MSRNNGNQKKRDEDNRDVWERPAFRRLAAEYAEGAGAFRSEGVPGGGADCVMDGAHSCKGA